MTEFQRLARDFGWDVTERFRDESGVWAVPGPPAPVRYPESGHASLAAAEEHSFWYRNRARAILDAVRSHADQACLWEVGAGNGHVAASLQAAGLPVVAVEPGPVGAGNAARRGLPTIRGTLADLELPDGSLGAVGMFDVLEHLDQPERLLAETKRVLRTGGVIVLTVPAYEWLWSDKDVIAGHVRRYSRPDLDQTLQQAGFEPVGHRYLFPLLVVPMLIRYRLPYALRRASVDLRAQVVDDLTGGGGGLLQRTVDAVFDAEGRITRRFRVPFGTSVLGIYRTP